MVATWDRPRFDSYLRYLGKNRTLVTRSSKLGTTVLQSLRQEDCWLQVADKASLYGIGSSVNRQTTSSSYGYISSDLATGRWLRGVRLASRRRGLLTEGNPSRGDESWFPSQVTEPSKGSTPPPGGLEMDQGSQFQSCREYSGCRVQENPAMSDEPTDGNLCTKLYQQIITYN